MDFGKVFFLGMVSLVIVIITVQVFNIFIEAERDREFCENKGLGLGGYSEKFPGRVLVCNKISDGSIEFLNFALVDGVYYPVTEAND